jgi:hypothetical protein
MSRGGAGESVMLFVYKEFQGAYLSQEGPAIKLWIYPAMPHTSRRSPRDKTPPRASGVGIDKLYILREIT